jgi:aerobic C4-dicarboxylate transport protein
VKKIFTNLTFWVLIAITAAILIGYFAPSFALYPLLDNPIKTKLLGQEISIGSTLSEFLAGIFISTVKLLINPIIFVTITLGIISMGDLKKVGRVGAKAVIYFEIVTTFALIIGVAVALIIKPGYGVSTGSTKGGDVAKYTHTEFSWLKFLENNSTLQVLIVALVLGIVFNGSKHHEKITEFLRLLAKYVFKILRIIMFFAPLGAFGGMAYTISKYGIATLIPLAKLMATVYVTMIIFIFGALGLILRYYHVSILKYLNHIKEELLIVLGTSSSEAALPSLMEKLERMGCSKSVVGLVVPAGYSFNLDGTTIYLSMCMIFLAQAFNVHLSGAQIFSIIGILMVTSKGAAGVTGSGFLVLASTITAIKVVPIEGLALLLGVDRFMSEARALTNFIGNGAATIWIANNEKEFDRSRMNEAFGHKNKSEYRMSKSENSNHN